MRVLFATSEATPFVKTGGLADVCGELPICLAKKGVDVSVVLPLYSSIPQKFRKDFENFIKKFRRRYGDCEYIKPVEYQGRGAIHCHLIIIFEKAPTVSITHENIVKCW